MSDADYVGQQFGSYIIIEFISGGTYGSVYKAKHAYFKDDPIVAIKILHPHFGSPEERAQFITEAQLLRKLKHPYILPVIDVGFQNDVLYMITQYAKGGTLRTRIKQQAGQPFSTVEAIRIITQVGEALHYAHQQEQHVVHCDLKPENILFNAKGDALLADFGIAAILATTGTKMLGSGGTPGYMAPEQFKGAVSPKIDQYALGCIAYELFAGRHPYNLQGVNALAAEYQHSQVKPAAPTTYNPHLPAHIETAIGTAMAKDRNNRYSNVAAFLAALQKTALLQPTTKPVISQPSTVPVTSPPPVGKYTDILSQTHPNSIERLFQKGVRAQASGNVEKAYRIYQQLEATPGIPEKYSTPARNSLQELHPQVISLRRKQAREASSLCLKQAREASLQGRWQDEIRLWEDLLALKPSARDIASLLILPLTLKKETGNIMQSIQVRLQIARQNEQYAWMYVGVQQFIQNKDAASASTQLQTLWRDAPCYGDPANLAQIVGLPATLNYEQAIAAEQAHLEQERQVRVRQEQARLERERQVRVRQEQAIAEQKRDKRIGIIVGVLGAVAALAAVMGFVLGVLGVLGVGTALGIAVLGALIAGTVAMEARKKS